MCRPHYNRDRLYGDPLYERPEPEEVRCSVTGCDAISESRGYCSLHYGRWKRHRDPAQLEPRPCEICGTLFDPAGPKSATCGKPACVHQRKTNLTRVYQATSRKRGPRKRPTYDRECPGCGDTFTTTSPTKTYCRTRCPGRPLANWERLRNALAATDYPAIIEALGERTTPDENGCWIWAGTHTSGSSYPQVGFTRDPITGGPRTYLVHRLMLEAKLGHPIGGMHSHHVCATRRCVNPDHLEPVTAAENVAEMMARKTFEARIKSLEADNAALREALSTRDPDHPLPR